jgi:hypothetical protein
LIHSESARFRKDLDLERLRPIHGNLDRRAKEALKYLVEVGLEYKIIDIYIIRH